MVSLDEASSALDSEITRSILGLLRQMADRVAVMDAGRVGEQGAVIQVFTNPQHTTIRSLIDEVLPRDLPASVIARIRHLMATEPGNQARLMGLAFAGEDSSQPLLSDVICRYGVDINIPHGQVENIQGQVFGSLALHARGEAALTMGATTRQIVFKVLLPGIVSALTITLVSLTA